MSQLTESYRTLTPAYGRDYKSLKEVKADFDANKDFILQPEGCYINKEQIAVGTVVNIRYKKLTMIAPIKVK